MERDCGVFDAEITRHCDRNGFDLEIAVAEAIFRYDWLFWWLGEPKFLQVTKVIPVLLGVSSVV
jgi:hypothetical protein